VFLLTTIRVGVDCGRLENGPRHLPPFFPPQGQKPDFVTVKELSHRHTGHGADKETQVDLSVLKLIYHLGNRKEQVGVEWLNFVIPIQNEISVSHPNDLKVLS
jgi:hypothetical protein